MIRAVSTASESTAGFSDRGIRDLVNRLIAQLKSGDSSARDELLKIASEQLYRHASNRLRHKYSRVGRFQDTGDVMQEALIKLNQALKSVDLSDAKHFFCLSAKQINWVLLNMQERHDKSGVFGRGHQTNPGAGVSGTAHADLVEGLADTTASAKQREQREHLLSGIEKLKPELRDAMLLRTIYEMTPDEIAAVLGVTRRSVDRYIAEALVQLSKILPPES